MGVSSEGTRTARSSGGMAEELVREVQAIQRRSPEWQHFWYSFCDLQGDGIRDPRQHSVAFLQRFLRSTSSGNSSRGEASRELRESREQREPREPRERQPREHREYHDAREPWESRGSREPREPREPRGRSRDRDRSREPTGDKREQVGFMDKDKGNYGFIRQDRTDETMFVMPQSCHGFGGAFPPVGTRVVFTVVMDQKTGRPRAEDVRPPSSKQMWHGPPPPPAPPPAPVHHSSFAEAAPEPESIVQHGTMEKEKGTFGFIRQDATEDHIFVMPQQCEGFGAYLPPLGTRVTYKVGTDPKHRKTIAEDVWPEESVESRARTVPPAQRTREPREITQGEERTGTIETNKGNYGFIQQDSTEEPMFVLPPFPPVGTRVFYRAVTDYKTHKVRAEDVRPFGKVHASSPAHHHHGADREAQNPRHVPPPQRAQSSRASAPALPALPEPPLPSRSSGKRKREADEFSGVMDKDKGDYGFILQDSNSQDLFIVPSQCDAFNNTLPPLGTRLVYCVGSDPKTGRPRAERVRPEAEDDGLHDKGDGVGEEHTGSMHADKGKFGFIKQDVGGEELYVLPAACTGFGNGLPPLGVRLIFRVAKDQRTGKLRAEDVRPERGGSGGGSSTRGNAVEGVLRELEDLVEEVRAVQRRSPEWMEFWESFCDTAGSSIYDPRRHQPPTLRHFLQIANEEGDYGSARSQAADREQHHGTMTRDKGSFGFITDDQTQDHVFVMPVQCDGFDGCLPPVGARVVYLVAEDPKTNRPRAEDVWPEETPLSAAEQASTSAQESSKWPRPNKRPPLEPKDQSPPEEHFGTMENQKGNYGFIRQDDSEEPMFVLPPLPPVGSRVAYAVVTDSKTGRPRAEDVRVVGKGSKQWKNEGSNNQDRMMQPAVSRKTPAQPANEPEAEDQAEIFSGAMHKSKGHYGFIVQDSDQEQVFVGPGQCEAFDFKIPAVGTRLIFKVGVDPKTGKARAEEVQPEPEPAEEEGLEETMPAEEEPVEGEERTGVIHKNRGSFGFIRQDNGEDDMFVLPTTCRTFNGVVPPLGTRVTYTVMMDPKTNTPRAEDVRREGTRQETRKARGAQRRQGNRESQDAEGQESREAQEGQEPGDDSQPPRELVNQVKSVQRRSPEWRNYWQGYCEDNGVTDYDPSRQDASFLEQFMSQVQAADEAQPDEVPLEEEDYAPEEVPPEEEVVPEEEPQPEKREPEEQLEDSKGEAEEEYGEALVASGKEEDNFEDLVGQVQEALDSTPEVWNKFCDREGGGERDPRKHPLEFLCHFIDDIYFYIRAASEGGARKGPPSKPDNNSAKESVKGSAKGSAKGAGGGGAKGAGKGAAKASARRGPENERWTVEAPPPRKIQRVGSRPPPGY